MQSRGSRGDFGGEGGDGGMGGDGGGEMPGGMEGGGYGGGEYGGGGMRRETGEQTHAPQQISFWLRVDLASGPHQVPAIN